MGTDLRRRLKGKSDAPAETRGDLPRISFSSKKKTKLHFTRPRKNGYSRLHQQNSRRKESLWWTPEQACIWSAGKTFNSAELETVRASKSPTTVMTANGEVQTREEATVCVKELDLCVTVVLLEEPPAIPSPGKLCEDHGYNYHWTSGQKPHLIRNGRKINCNTANYVPFVVPGLSTSSLTSSSPTSLTSSSQETVTPTEHPASTRSESTSEEVRRNSSHGPAETDFLSPSLPWVVLFVLFGPSWKIQK